MPTKTSQERRDFSVGCPVTTDEELTDAVRRAAGGDVDAVAALTDRAEFWASSAGRSALTTLACSAFIGDLVGPLLDVGVHASRLLVSATGVVNADIIERLLVRGADPNHVDGSGATALMKAPDARTARLLFQHGADVDAGSYCGMRCVHAVAHAGRLDVLRLLEEHGSDLDDDTADFDGACTPLMCACFGGSFDVARFLVSEGVLLDRKSTKNQKTALHFAIERGHFQLARLLVDRGAGLQVIQKTGATPLHAAIAKGKAAVGMAAYLIERGAPLDVQDKVGLTPLMLAVTKKQPKLVRHLLAKGADQALGLLKAKKFGKTKLEVGATVEQIAEALGRTSDLEGAEERSFAKEQNMLFHNMPALEPPAEVVSSQALRRGAAPWGPRFWQAFGQLPGGLAFAQDGDRNRLRQMAEATLDERCGRLRESVLAATKHRLSDGFLALYTATFDVRVHWRPVDGAYPFANFRVHAPEEMFFGPNLSRPKKRYDAHKALRFAKGQQPELRKYYLLAGEEYGETLLSLAGGEETLHFMAAANPGQIVPMTVDFSGYLEALLCCRGLHGWQGYFLTDASRSGSFESDLAQLFGDDSLRAFLELAG